MHNLILPNQIAKAAPTRERPGDIAVSYAEALEADLRKYIEGEVAFDNGSRAIYSTDSSNYRQVPIGVVIPKTVDDVVATVAAARRYGAPILARGGGTSLAGQCCNVAVVLDFSKYLNRLIYLDPDGKQATVEPGIVLDRLRNAAGEHGLTFGPDPATHNHNTLGGMIGNNSCGTHSVMAGKTEENIDELEILTYDGVRIRVGPTSDGELEQIIRAGGRRGEIYTGLKGIRDKYANLIRQRYPKIPRRVSGYNLNELLPENGFHVARALVGSECTLALTLQAKCKLVWNPPSRSLLVLGYPDIFHTADHVMDIMDTGPIACEAVDEMLVEDMKKKGLHTGDLNYLPEGRGWLLVEYGGHTKEEADEKARRTMEVLKRKSDTPEMKLYDKAEDAAKIWEVRGEAGLGASAWIPGQHVTWEAGKTPRCRRKSSDPTCGNCAMSMMRTAIRAHSMVILGKGAFTHESRSISTRRKESSCTAALWMMRPRSSPNMAALSPESMATASQRPNFSLRCSVLNWSKPSASSSKFGIPNGR